MIMSKVASELEIKIPSDGVPRLFSFAKTEGNKPSFAIA